MLTTEERFWAKVSKTETCWLWQGKDNGDGYGTLETEGRRMYAHRYAYELLVGPIPVGLQIDHLCRVRHCVNPDHMETVTNKENTLRGENFIAQQARRTHCPKGHIYDLFNTRWWQGMRFCRTCQNGR